MKNNVCLQERVTSASVENTEEIGEAGIRRLGREKVHGGRSDLYKFFGFFFLHHFFRLVPSIPNVYTKCPCSLGPLKITLIYLFILLVEHKRKSK